MTEKTEYALDEISSKLGKLKEEVSDRIGVLRGSLKTICDELDSPKFSCQGCGTEVDENNGYCFECANEKPVCSRCGIGNDELRCPSCIGRPYPGMGIHSALPFWDRLEAFLVAARDSCCDPLEPRGCAMCRDADDLLAEVRSKAAAELR